MGGGGLAPSRMRVTVTPRRRTVPSAGSVRRTVALESTTGRSVATPKPADWRAATADAAVRPDVAGTAFDPEAT